MKKIYETAQMKFVMFANTNVIVASAIEDEPVTPPSYDKGSDETEIL